MRLVGRSRPGVKGNPPFSNSWDNSSACFPAFTALLDLLGCFLAWTIVTGPAQHTFDRAFDLLVAKSCCALNLDGQENICSTLSPESRIAGCFRTSGSGSCSALLEMPPPPPPKHRSHLSRHRSWTQETAIALIYHSRHSFLLLVLASCSVLRQTQ